MQTPSQKTLNSQIKQENDGDADDAVEFDQLKPRQQDCYNMAVFFREQDRPEILAELDRVKICGEQLMVFKQSPGLMVFEIASLDLIKHLPALFRPIPISLPVTID